MTARMISIGLKKNPPGYDRGSSNCDGHAPFPCPITSRLCEGDLSHLCEEYGCARKGGLSPHSHENL